MSSLHVSRDDLVDTLERQILSGALAVGAALPSERRVAAQFSVSRSVVREAFGVLAERRLIAISTGRGAFVREPDPTAAATVLANSMRGKRVTARHAIDGRRLLESETASLAAQARTDEDITVIQAAIDSLSEQDDLLDRVRADLSFHLGVARASHNPVLEAMFGAMSGLAAELMLRSLSDPDVAKAALPQHSEILRAIVARDSAVARETMICHLEVAITHYGDDLDLELETIAERRLRDVVGVRKTLDDLFRLAAGIERTGGGGAN